MTCAQGLLRLLWGGPKLECYGTVSRTFMQTLRNESNDTEKHEKVIKTQYHLNSLERTFLFANAVMTLS